MTQVEHTYKIKHETEKNNRIIAHINAHHDGNMNPKCPRLGSDKRMEGELLWIRLLVLTFGTYNILNK